jgi:hypothetical protein
MISRHHGWFLVMVVAGRNTANVKSGAFASAMQDFAKDRVDKTSQAQGALDSANAFYQSDLGDRRAQLASDQKF